MLRRFTRYSALLAALSFAGGTVAQQDFAPAPLELNQVQDDLYVIRNSQSGNVTVLVTDRGVVLIDDKFDRDYAGIVEMVGSITDQPIRYVINTHYHEDHSGSNAQMQAADAIVFAAENARSKMIEDERGGLPDVTVDEYLRLYIADIPVDLYYFGRSHTNGDVVIHLPEHRVVVMGDMFAGGTAQLIHYAAGGSARDWPLTLDKALALDFETVIPGHSPVTDREALENYRHLTNRVQAMVLEMNRQERSRAEIETVLRDEFGWGEFFIDLGLDGIIAEMQ
jgi:cyclase